MSKPREWTIPLGVGGFYDGKEVNFAIGPIVNGKLPNPGSIRVIEKFAYDQLEQKVHELEAEIINSNKFAQDQENRVHELETRSQKLVEALERCRGAMTYAYDDHSDQYYLNVKSDIEQTLAEYKAEK